MFMVINSYVVDEFAYTMLVANNSANNYPGVILKLDTNGVIEDSFAVMRSLKYKTYEYLLYAIRFYVLSDSSIIIFAQTTYLQGEIGISDSSQIDLSIFKINSTKDIEWNTSVDFMNGVEEYAHGYIYKNKLYASVSTSKFYLWLFSLDIRTGYLLNFKCIYLYRAFNNYRDYIVLYVSDLYVYTHISVTSSYPSLVFMHSSNTLQLVKAFNITEFYLPVVIQNSYNSSMINIIFTERQTFFSLLINENDLTYIGSTLNTTWKLRLAARYGLAMAKHLNDKFVLSVSDRMLYDEIGIYGLDCIFLIVDFDLNTNSCISLDKSNGIPGFIDDDLNLFLNQNETHYNMSAPPNMFYSPSLSLYEKNADPGEYIFNDITEALWPRYFWNDLGSWHFNLPQFNLSNSYKMPIGKKISSQLFKLTPFIHWQNSLFVFTAIDANTSSIPGWMTIDLVAKTITIDLSQILSIQTTYNMIFNAELVPFPSPSPNFTQFPHNYLTIDYPWYFEFSNSPWDYISSNHSYYLVLDKPTIFRFIFDDKEDDYISMKVIQSENINYHIQTSSNDSSIINLYLQSYNTSNSPVQLTLQYTDTYHDDAIFYKSNTYDIYLFAVDPPIFSQELQGINATRWIDYTFNLPLVLDVNNLDWKVSLADPPSWISLNSNNSIFLSTSDINIQIPETTLLTIKITNSMNAWSKYNLTINVQSASIPIFGKINDVSLSRSNANILKIDYEGDSAIITVDWSNNVQISWIYFNDSSHELIINTKYVNLENQWIMLKANDSCNRAIYSNRFKISILNKTSLYIGNTFGPLLMFIGEKKVFFIPNDLFISSDPSSLRISVQVINWSTSMNITVYVEYSKQFESYYLYLNSITPNICHLSLSVTDSSDQTIEISFEFDVLSCASKDWLKWTSNIQSGCTEWIDNYVLDSTGACLWGSSYLRKSFLDIINVCGLIVLIILIINLLMMVIWGVSILQSFEFAQTLIVFICFSPNANKNMIDLGSWLQIAKIDFGFLNIIKVTYFLSWDLDPMLVKVNFYCQTTILNYFYVTLLIVLFIILLKIMKLLSRAFAQLQSISNSIEHRLNKESIAWIFIHLFLPFLLINIISDVITYDNHLYLLKELNTINDLTIIYI